MTNDYVVANGAAQVMPSGRFAELIAAVLAKGASFRFQANGISMFPFIRDGDVLTIAPKPELLRLGDTAAFVSAENDRLIVHRVVRIDCHSYLIRGDNCEESDGYISHTDILGYVTRVEHRGSHVWIGLGIERIVIAFLSRRGWLIYLVAPIHYFFHLLIKRFKP